MIEKEINYKDKNKRKKILKILLPILIIGACLFGRYYTKGYIFNESKSNETVKLKYTDTDTKVNATTKSGTYITDVSDVVEEVMPSIVAITSKTLVSSGRFGPSYWSENRYAEGAGSGIIISNTSDELLILTNNHVIENASELVVQFIDEKTTEATVKGTNASKDVAIISVKLSDLSDDTKNNIKVATLGDSKKLKVGNGVIAIGNALGYGQSVTTGIISALDREVTIDNNTNKMIQIDAAINGGNSGGALLNSSGEVVGINSAKYSSSSSDEASVEGMGFAIPITDIKDLINDLVNQKTTENNSDNITLGITGYIVNVANEKGFYIASIEKNSLASKNNLQTSSVIMKIDDKSVESVETISNVLKSKSKGDKIKLTILNISNRGYEQQEITINL